MSATDRHRYGSPAGAQGIHVRPAPTAGASCRECQRSWETYIRRRIAPDLQVQGVRSTVGHESDRVHHLVLAAGGRHLRCRTHIGILDDRLRRCSGLRGGRQRRRIVDRAPTLPTAHGVSACFTMADVHLHSMLVNRPGRVVYGLATTETALLQNNHTRPVHDRCRVATVLVRRRT